MKQLKILFSREAAKAWLAALSVLITALITGNQDGSLDLNDWLQAASAVVITLGVVFGVPNAKPKIDE